MSTAERPSKAVWRGVTLVELLVALVLTGIVISLGSMVYVPAHRQAIERLKDFTGLGTRYLERSSHRKYCRDSLQSIRISDWRNRWDACMDSGQAINPDQP
ncbi:MAG: prepilin-type N-terminal cleavage/methylation domain-containing protein [Fibrobacteres bacterium]|nr:prepilin-type N-terminal cleavage/methylation domain-containing protein [Fibrobacterota bacterium]